MAARRHGALAASILAIALTGCGSGALSQTAAPTAATGLSDDALAALAAKQRACVGDLETHLQTLATKRIDAFLGQTLNGLVVCDAGNGLAHLPTRDVSAWLNGADGKPHSAAIVPAQPAEIATVPHDGPARIRYQRDCIAWMRRYLPASIAKDGDDPDTAAADVFNGIEECDAVAGLATISREKLAGWVKSKNLI